MPVNAAWRNNYSGVKVADVRAVAKRLDAVVKAVKEDNRPDGSIDQFELGLAIHNAGVSYAVSRAAFTLLTDTVTSNAKGAVRDFLKSSVTSDRNGDGTIDASELRDVNSKTQQVLVDLAANLPE